MNTLPMIKEETIDAFIAKQLSEGMTPQDWADEQIKLLHCDQSHLEQVLFEHAQVIFKGNQDDVSSGLYLALLAIRLIEASVEIEQLEV